MNYIIKVEAEQIGVFTTFQVWVNKASGWLSGFPKTERIICIDKNGNACTNGLDMQEARDNNLFPVTAYRLVRTSEITKP